MPAVTEGKHHVVVIEGTDWSAVDAAELARRVRHYVGDTHDLMHAATSLAERVEHGVEIGGGDPVVLTADEKKVAYPVLNEWRQFGTSPDAVDALFHQIAAP